MSAGSRFLPSVGMTNSFLFPTSSRHQCPCFAPNVTGSYNSPVMSFLRFLMVLSLVVWIGGLIFFAFVLAPTAFQVLPNTHLAGNVVGRALGKLHWIAIIAGIVFLIASLLHSYLTQGTAHIFAM